MFFGILWGFHLFGVFRLQTTRKILIFSLFFPSNWQYMQPSNWCFKSAQRSAYYSVVYSRGGGGWDNICALHLKSVDENVLLVDLHTINYIAPPPYPMTCYLSDCIFKRKKINTLKEVHISNKCTKENIIHCRSLLNQRDLGKTHIKKVSF